MIIRLFLLLAAAFFFCTSPGHTQEIDPGIIKAQAGRWLVAATDGSQGCVLKFTTDKTIGGYGIVEDVPCPENHLLHGKAYAWNFSEGDLLILDAERKVLLRLQEQEGSPYKTVQGSVPEMILVTAAAGVDRIPNAKDLFGEWDILSQSGRPICRVTLQDKAPEGGQESYGLKTTSCDKAIASLKLETWVIDNMSVMFYGSDGEALDFIQDGKGNYMTLPEDEKPKLMLRRAS